MTKFLDQDGIEFDLNIGWHDTTYRKADKQYTVPGEAMIAGLGNCSFGRAYWLNGARCNCPEVDRGMLKRDLESAFAELNGKLVFE